jgi:hypothetical protein
MWRGIHNISKTRAFLVLYDRKYHKKDTTGLGVHELHLQSGVDYDYLRTKLVKWAQWGYLNRRPVEVRGRATWAYTIAAKGERFIKDIVPPEVLRQCVEAVKEHRAQRSGEG